MPAESPTLGLGHLQFEALLTTALLSPNANDFALIAMLGLLGLRIFEACGANIGDFGEDEGPRQGRPDRGGDLVCRAARPPATTGALPCVVGATRRGGAIVRSRVPQVSSRTRAGVVSVGAPRPG